MVTCWTSWLARHPQKLISPAGCSVLLLDIGILTARSPTLFTQNAQLFTQIYLPFCKSVLLDEGLDQKGGENDECEVKRGKVETKLNKKDNHWNLHSQDVGALVLDERKEVVKGKALVTVAARYCVWRSWGNGLNYDIGDLSDIWNCTFGICTCGKI